MNTAPQNDAPIVFISLFKSGTWFFRKIITELTGLDFIEPEIDYPCDYTNPDKLFTPPLGTFYSWHLVPTLEVVAKLRTMRARPVLLIRNIHALVVSGYHHFRENIDAEIRGESGADRFFQSYNREQGLTSFIQGITTPEFTWEGIAPQLSQMEMMLRLATEYPCFLTSYERLLGDKNEEIKRLAGFLGLVPDEKEIQRIVEQSDFVKMKTNTPKSGKSKSSSHFRKGKTDSYLHELEPTHYQQIYEIIHQVTPQLPRLASQKDFPEILQAATNWPLELGRPAAPSNFCIQKDLPMAAPPKALKGLPPPLRQKSTPKLALAPANTHTAIARTKLQQIGVQPDIFDRAPSRSPFPCKVRPYEDITLKEYDQIVVMSPVSGAEIRKGISKILRNKEKKGTGQPIILLNYKKKGTENDLLTAQEFVGEAEDHSAPDELRRLGEKVETNKPLLVFWGSYYSDLIYKINLSQEITGTQILWVRPDVNPKESLQSDIHVALPNEALTFLRHHFTPDQLTFFILHDNMHFTLPLLLKKIFPGARIISYVYSWLNLFCPYLHKEKIAFHYHWHDTFTDSEYLGVRSIIEGTSVDGVIYKDGGEDFYLLANTPVPKLFLPTYQAKETFQTPPAPSIPPIPNKLVFIGTLFPASTVVSEHFFQDIFQDMFLINMFKRLSDCGLHIDAYDYKGPDIVLDEYRIFFAPDHKVNIYRGKILGELLPKIAGRYHWGLMLHDDDYRIIKEHTKITLPSKMFTYTSLGIPILISAELEFAAEYVRQHKIGIIIQKEDLNNVADIMDRADYPQLIENVIAFRREHDLEQSRTLLAEFLKKICLL